MWVVQIFSPFVFLLRLWWIFFLLVVAVADLFCFYPTEVFCFCVEKCISILFYGCWVWGTVRPYPRWGHKDARSGMASAPLHWLPPLKDIKATSPQIHRPSRVHASGAAALPPGSRAWEGRRDARVLSQGGDPGLVHLCIFLNWYNVCTLSTLKEFFKQS